jgi:hypothetical protein
VRWSGVPEMAMWVQDPDGEIVAHHAGGAVDFRIELSAGDYTFTVQQPRKNEVSYRAVISYGD